MKISTISTSAVRRSESCAALKRHWRISSGPLRLNPGSAAVCYEMGYVYMDRKQYPQAVFFYDLAIKRDDSIASFYNNRGLCKIEMKEYLARRPRFHQSHRTTAQSCSLSPPPGHSLPRSRTPRDGAKVLQQSRGTRSRRPGQLRLARRLPRSPGRRRSRGQGPEKDGKS